MPLPPILRSALLDPRLRVALGCVVAFFWYVLAILGETGRNPALVAIIGIPAVLVLVWWRTRTAVAIVLSGVTLLLCLAVAAIGRDGSGLGVLAATGWFAVLGGSVAADRRLRIAAAGLALFATFVSLFFWYGTGWTFGFVAVAFMAALALGLGWTWRQLQDTDLLRTRLAATASRADTAERDAALEVERNRIAREVHDVVAHSLAVVAAQADGARYAAEANPASVGPALEAIADTARRALGEVRTMLHDLKASGPGGVAPGAADIAALVDGVRGLGVEVQQATYGDERPLDREQGLALYRVAQEALTNAMRHGDGDEPVGLTLDWGERQVILVVTNSVPAGAASASERAGHGIDGMRERAAEVGGDCTAGLGSNGLFRVRVSLPVAEPAPEAAQDGPEDRVEQHTSVGALLALFGSEPAEAAGRRA